MEEGEKSHYRREKKRLRRKTRKTENLWRVSMITTDKGEEEECVRWKGGDVRNSPRSDHVNITRGVHRLESKHNKTKSDTFTGGSEWHFHDTKHPHHVTPLMNISLSLPFTAHKSRWKVRSILRLLSTLKKVGYDGKADEEEAMGEEGEEEMEGEGEIGGEDGMERLQ